MIKNKYNCLIVGASYGSLLAMKLIMAGHSVKIVGQNHEVDAINKKGINVSIKTKLKQKKLILNSKNYSKNLKAIDSSKVNCKEIDIAFFALKEIHFSQNNIIELVKQLAEHKVPAVALMNMPPLTILKKNENLKTKNYKNYYLNPEIWEIFDQKNLTATSADPQTICNICDGMVSHTVTLNSNFKISKFQNFKHDRMLINLENDIKNIRVNNQRVPILLKIYESKYIFMTKWPMLITGNYRCFTAKGIRSIKESVFHDLKYSEKIYNSIYNLCIKLGCSKNDLVEFRHYANAAKKLIYPSSFSREIDKNKISVERLDKLIKKISEEQSVKLNFLNDITEKIELRLDNN
tara:strand:- start:806 stop:1852 length:1047 start_codon:yes stop_codon:yes gene_type:complete